MKQKRLSGVLSIVLAAAVFFTFQLVFVQEASAASGTKTVYQPTKIVSTYKYDDEKPTTYTQKFTYDSHGLVKKSTDSGLSGVAKVTYTRNKAGAVKKINYYNNKGKLFQTTTNTIKNGNAVKSATYEVSSSGKKTLMYKSSNTYNSKGRITKSVGTDADGGKSTTTYTYYSNGKFKSMKTKADTYTSEAKFNKKGYETSYSEKEKNGNYSKSTYTYKFNSKGDPISEIGKSTSKYGNEIFKSKDTTKTKYTYNKAGKKTKAVYTSVMKSDDYTSKSTYTLKYTYKKFKVAKKYQKYLMF